MELFEFKRYLGDEAPSSSKSASESKLDDYLEKVKKRKRLREESSHVEDNEAARKEDKTSEHNDSLSLRPRSIKKKRFGEQKNIEDALSDYLKRVKLRKQTREETLDKQEDGVLEHFKTDVDSALSTSEEPRIDDTSNNEFKSGFVLDDKRRKVKKVGLNQNHEDTFSEEVEVDRNKQLTSTDLNSESVAKKPKKKKKKKVKTDDNSIKDELDKEENNETFTKNPTPVVTFEVLGAHSFQNKVKVKRVLPRWLAEPTVISASLSSNRDVKDVSSLHRIFIRNLESMGIKELFPVQLMVIPHQLQCYKKINYLWPRDLCVSAPTGSGKTLAYVLPILQAYFHCPKKALYALVVVPVQELALQVAKVFKEVASGTGIKIGCVTGGTDRNVEAKHLVFKRDDGIYSNLVQILVATPGRLMEHFFLTPGFNVKDLKFIVIDEADRVVEQKSLNWLHLIEKQCNPSFNGTLPPVTFHNLTKCLRGPQKLLFSATLSQDPEKLLKLNLFQPKLITSVSDSKVYNGDDNKNHFYGKFTTPESLCEKYIICDIDKKPLLVHKLLVGGWQRVLIFTKSCLEANRLCELLKILNKNIKIEELTSQMILGKRQLVVSDFDRGTVDVLVCSDRMARGMDINDVNYVIIYDPPKYAKGYIHKAGRTGRAGKSGTAMTILTQKQSNGFLQMLKKAGKTNLELVPFDESELEDFIPAYEEALVSLKTLVTSQKNTKLNNTIKEKRTKTIIKNKKRKMLT